MAGSARRWRNRLGLGMLAAALIVSLALAWRREPVLVETAPVTRGAVVMEIVEQGKTRVRERYVVSAPVPGALARIALEPGDVVQAGQIIAHLTAGEPVLLDGKIHSEATARLEAALDSRRATKAAVEAAEARAAQLVRELPGLRTLAAEGGLARRDLQRAETEARIAEEQLAVARFDYAVAGHEVETARSILDPARIIAGEQRAIAAPVAGRVLRVLQESGGVVAAGAPLVEIGDTGSLEIVVDVLSEHAVRVEPGDPAWIEDWGGPPLPAHVHRVEPAAMTTISALGIEEQRVDVIVHLDSPVRGREALGDSYRVEARISIDRRDDVLVVPEAAVFRHGGGDAVFRANDKRAWLAPVALGLRNGVEAELVEGLQLDDRVIVHPSELLEDGARIRIAE